MTPEHRYRIADHDLPPLTPAEFIADQRVNTNLFAEYGLLAIIILAGIICVALALLNSRAGASSFSLRDPLDVEFERHVERETKKLCRYQWAMGRASMWPERVLVCGKAKGRAA